MVAYGNTFKLIGSRLEQLCGEVLHFLRRYGEIAWILTGSARR
jgi:hypothetical protein